MLDLTTYLFTVRIQLGTVLLYIDKTSQIKRHLYIQVLYNVR